MEGKGVLSHAAVNAIWEKAIFAKYSKDIHIPKLFFFLQSER